MEMKVDNQMETKEYVGCIGERKMEATISYVVSMFFFPLSRQNPAKDASLRMEHQWQHGQRPFQQSLNPQPLNPNP